MPYKTKQRVEKHSVQSTLDFSRYSIRAPRMIEGVKRLHQTRPEVNLKTMLPSPPRVGEKRPNVASRTANPKKVKVVDGRGSILDAFNTIRKLPELAAKRRTLKYKVLADNSIVYFTDNTNKGKVGLMLEHLLSIDTTSNLVDLFDAELKTIKLNPPPMDDVGESWKEYYTRAVTQWKETKKYCKEVQAVTVKKAKAGPIIETTWENSPVKRKLETVWLVPYLQTEAVEVNVVNATADTARGSDGWFLKGHDKCNDNTVAIRFFFDLSVILTEKPDEKLYPRFDPKVDKPTVGTWLGDGRTLSAAAEEEGIEIINTSVPPLATAFENNYAYIRNQRFKEVLNARVNEIRWRLENIGADCPTGDHCYRAEKRCQLLGDLKMLEHVDERWSACAGFSSSIENLRFWQCVSRGPTVMGSWEYSAKARRAGAGKFAVNPSKNQLLLLMKLWVWQNQEVPIPLDELLTKTELKILRIVPPLIRNSTAAYYSHELNQYLEAVSYMDKTYADWLPALDGKIEDINVSLNTFSQHLGNDDAYHKIHGGKPAATAASATCCVSSKPSETQCIHLKPKGSASGNKYGGEKGMGFYLSKAFLNDVFAGTYTS